ncbi:hypothetical protein Tco_0556647 [Tanacetum coccineum]
MNDHLKAHRDFQQVMDDSMSKLREMFQTWLQQRQEQVVNLDSYTLEFRNVGKFSHLSTMMMTMRYLLLLQEYLLRKFSHPTPILSAITSDLPKSDSPIMEDEHLDTILETESDELIKFSVEDLVYTPSESDGISEGECDLPVCDDSSPKKDEVLDDIVSIPPRNGNDHFNAESSPIESVLNRDNVISYPKIDLLIEEFTSELALIDLIPSGIVEANLDPKEDIHFIENLMYDNSFPRPPKTLKDASETVIDSNNDFSSSDDDSYEDIDYVDASPSPINEIESLKDNPTPSSDFVTKSSSTSPNFFLEETNTFDNSLPESETFCFNLGKRESVWQGIEPEAWQFHTDVVEDIFDNPTREPRVHVPNVLPAHPTLYLDSDFTISSDSLGSDLVVSFPSGTRNKIFDPGIFIGVQSKIFLSRDAFSISFIRDPFFLVIDTLLLFSSENEDKVVNTGILVADEEESPHLSSHQGLKDLNESLMMISRGLPPLITHSYLDCFRFPFYPLCTSSSMGDDRLS